MNFSVNNLFDKKYLSSARSIQFNAKDYGKLRGRTPFYNVGEERTIIVSLQAKF